MTIFFRRFLGGGAVGHGGGFGAGRGLRRVGLSLCILRLRILRGLLLVIVRCEQRLDKLIRVYRAQIDAAHDIIRAAAALRRNKLIRSRTGCGGRAERRFANRRGLRAEVCAGSGLIRRGFPVTPGAALCSRLPAGSAVGSTVGTGVGSTVGTGVGAAVGTGVGATVGTGVGTGVGADVGTGVATVPGAGVNCGRLAGVLYGGAAVDAAVPERSGT